jgi:hypothetical protein
MHLPWTQQELIEQYEWKVKPDEATRVKTGVDQFPRGAEWWNLDCSDYRNQGGTREPWLEHWDIKHWWISRIEPGMTFPIHQDYNWVNHTRLWIPMSDYEFGHVFIVNGELIRDYRRGDIIEFSGADWHGAANLIPKPKLSLQCAVIPRG